MYNVNEPIWNAENINKKSGDTTFSTCGWCEHGGSGSHRYGCMVDGKCNLLKNYDNEVQWDTKCKLKNFGKSDIDQIIESKENNIYEYNNGIKRKEKEIEILKSLIVDDSPPLPDSRKYDCFNIGDDIMVFPTFDDATIKFKWLKGKVVSGYRHHDGCVSAYIDEKYHEGSLDGHGYGSGYTAPNILLKSEYDYFVENPYKFHVWIKAACSKLSYISADTFELPS